MNLDVQWCRHLGNPPLSVMSGITPVNNDCKFTMAVFSVFYNIHFELRHECWCTWNSTSSRISPKDGAFGTAKLWCLSCRGLDRRRCCSLQHWTVRLALLHREGSYI